MSAPARFDGAASPAGVPVPPAAPSAPRSAEEISEDEERTDEYKETWLKMWSNTTNPKHISCTTAFDIVAWCFGPVNQLRHLYRTGTPTVCTQQFDDLKLCFKVMAKSGGDDSAAREMLRADRRKKEDPRPHVFPMRTEPPVWFRHAPVAAAAASSSTPSK